MEWLITKQLNGSQRLELERMLAVVKWGSDIGVMVQRLDQISGHANCKVKIKVKEFWVTLERITFESDCWVASFYNNHHRVFYKDGNCLSLRIDLLNHTFIELENWKTVANYANV